MNIFGFIQSFDEMMHYESSIPLWLTFFQVSDDVNSIIYQNFSIETEKIDMFITIYNLNQIFF